MSYASLDDLNIIYGKGIIEMLYPDDFVAGGDMADPLLQALKSASSEIDMRLGGRYKTPLIAVPDAIKNICIDMAIYKASSDTGCLTEERRQRYEDAIALLRDVAKGLASIGFSDSDDDTDKVADQNIAYHGPARLFNRASLKGL